MRKHFRYGEHSDVSDSECIPCYFEQHPTICKQCGCGERRLINGRYMCGMVNERKYELIEWGYYFPCEYQKPYQMKFEE